MIKVDFIEQWDAMDYVKNSDVDFDASGSFYRWTDKKMYIDPDKVQYAYTLYGMVFDKSDGTVPEANKGVEMELVCLNFGKDNYIYTSLNDEIKKRVLKQNNRGTLICENKIPEPNPYTVEYCSCKEVPEHTCQNIY